MYRIIKLWSCKELYIWEFMKYNVSFQVTFESNYQGYYKIID